MDPRHSAAMPIELAIVTAHVNFINSPNGT
jgi:hypothetical protein